MAVRVKVTPLNINYDLILSKTLSPQAQSKVFADFAGQIIEDAKSQNARVLGKVPPYTVSVDGRLGAALESVRPGGTIFVEFELVIEAVEWIREMLRQHSPVKTGRYQSSHVLIADGVAVDEGAVPPLASKLVFVNIQPYARKIERGLSSQAPDGVYQSVAQLASAKFSNVAKIKFGYETPLFGAVKEWADTPSARALAKRRRGGRPDRHTEWLVRQPAIIITL